MLFFWAFYLSKITENRFSTHTKNAIERKQRQQQLKPSQNPWVQVLFIYIGECTGHVLAWPGQFSLAAIGILGKYTAWRCVRLVLHSLLVRTTASIPHLLLHTGNQYLVDLEPPNSYLCHHAWGFQPLPLRAKWCVISSAVWSFGQLLSCRINVRSRKSSWGKNPKPDICFQMVNIRHPYNAV